MDASTVGTFAGAAIVGGTAVAGFAWKAYRAFKSYVEQVQTFTAREHAQTRLMLAGPNPDPQSPVLSTLLGPIERISSGLDRLDRKVDGLHTQIDAIDERRIAHEERLDSLDDLVKQIERAKVEKSFCAAMHGGGA